MPNKIDQYKKWAVVLTVLCLCFDFFPALSYGASDYSERWDFKTYNYITAATSGTFVDMENKTESDSIELGFDFDFYGVSYHQIIVGENGTVYLASNGAKDPNGARIVVLEENVDVSKGGSIHTFSSSLAGSEFFVVEWVGVPVVGKGGSRQFEVILYKDNGEILIQYKSLRGGGDINSAVVQLVSPANIPDSILTSFVDEGQSILLSNGRAALDADSDDMPDLFEKLFGLDVDCSDDVGTECKDGNLDHDEDGLENLEEFQAGTKVNDSDSDGDGLLDKLEVPDPVNPRDSDGNGIIDALETDSDKDGIRDANSLEMDDGDVALKEDVNENGNYDNDGNETNAMDPDTDEDRFNDAMEIVFGTDPTDGLAANPDAVPDLLGYTIVTGTIQDAINAALPGDILYIPNKTSDPSNPFEPYVENLTINEAITLIGAGSDNIFIEGTITISGAEGMVLTGVTIQNADPGIRILGHGTENTGVNVIKVSLKNCVNGVLISDLSASGGTGGTTTKALLDQIHFLITQPMDVGYGVRVEGLMDGSDDVEIRNSTFPLTGSSGAILITGSDGSDKDFILRGNTITNAYEPAFIITDSDKILVEKNLIQNNYGHGIQIEGSSSFITVNRNTISINGGNGILVAASSSDVTITDNSISANKGYGISSETTNVVNNSGNDVPDEVEIGGNKLGSYNNLYDTLNESETASSVVGVTSAGLVFWESAAWLNAASGGAVAVIDAPAVLQDPNDSLLGTTMSFQAGDLTDDALVSIGTTTDTEDWPVLPISSGFLSMAIEISIPNQTDFANSAAVITLPVLAGFDPSVLRVFQLLNGNQWEEIMIPGNNYLPHAGSQVETSVHQRVELPDFNRDNPEQLIFQTVIVLPVLSRVNRNVGGGCGIANRFSILKEETFSFDIIILNLPLLFLVMRRWIRSTR